MATSKRVSVSGSVDDGKSTFIGRLLHDLNLIKVDVLEKLKDEALGDSKQEINFAEICDGLSGERKQGITINAGYKYLNIKGKQLTLIDTPGHAKFLLNMASGASSADQGIIIVGADRPLKPLTKLHFTILSIMGVHEIVVVVNKMDLVDWQESVFEQRKSEVNKFLTQFSFAKIEFLPVSALSGDNVTLPSCHLGWFKGPTAVDALLSCGIQYEDLQKLRRKQPLCLPIQLVDKKSDQRWLVFGTLVEGSIEVGTQICLHEIKHKFIVKNIWKRGLVDSVAEAGDSVCIELEGDHQPQSRDIIVRVDHIRASKKKISLLLNRKLNLDTFSSLELFSHGKFEQIEVQKLDLESSYYLDDNLNFYKYSGYVSDERFVGEPYNRFCVYDDDHKHTIGVGCYHNRGGF